jgi:hypothetical protein
MANNEKPVSLLAAAPVTALDLLTAIVRALVAMGGLGGITYLNARGSVDAAATVAVYSTVLSLYGAAAIQRVQNQRNGSRPLE